MPCYCNQGFLKLSVWLYVDQSNGTMDFTHTNNGHAEELEAVTEVKTGRPPSLNVANTVKLRDVGQVEISDEATLEDLKTQVEYEGHFLQLHQHLGKNAVWWFIVLFPSDVDAACPSGRVRAHSCLHACVAAWRTEACANPQRKTAHAQVLPL